MPAGFVLAAALLSGAGPSAEAPRPALETYELVESVRTVSPAGENSRSFGGTVRVSGGRARWELSHGTFPRSSAAVAIADGAVLTLLDPKEKLAASAAPEDFTSLFRGRPAAEGSAAVSRRDVSVRLTPDGAGRAFEGRPTARYALEASWTLVLATTGRVARVATSLKGTIEVLDEPAARSAFDAFGRLVPARGEAAEALEAELARLPGLPVSASLDVASKSTVEQPGMPSGTEPPRRPVEAHQTITRKVANLAVRPGSGSDEALFAIPDDFHSRGLDRLAPRAAFWNCPLSPAVVRPARADGRSVTGLAGLAPLVPELLAGRPLAVLTGAGVSAESGLPTFRGPGGIWEGRSAMELATPEAFAEDAARVWRFYEWRRAKLRDARPNAGHVALARIEKVVPRMTLVTQNVDGLHRAAGSRSVLELHGTILATRCTGCGAHAQGPDGPFPELPPRCACGGLLRPDVVGFGERLPEGVFEAAAEAAASSAVFLVAGTSSVVAPASSLAMIAARGGAKVFEVNPEETPLSPFAAGGFRARSADFLPLLADAIEEAAAA